jgi:hypothetical protein
MGFRKRLTAAMSTQTKITVDLKPKHANRQEGFVVGIGEKWCLLAATIDGGYFDGYQAFRVKDVARIRRDKSFQPTFSRTQPEWPPSSPPVDLDSTVGLVSSLAAFSPLIGIEMAADRDGLWIGTLYLAEPEWIWLHEVGPDGSWDDEAWGCRTRKITNVRSTDHYLTALAAVADDQPTLPPPHERTA